MYIASSVASSIATSGLPANAIHCRTIPSAIVDCASAASNIRRTGMRMVRRVVTSDGSPSRRARCGELIGNCARAVPVPAADEPADERTRHERDGQAHDERVEKCPPRVRAEPLDCRQRSRVRRHQAVRGGEAGNERDSETQEGQPGLPGDREEDRREQDQADLEEHRQADEESRQQKRPVEPTLTERGDESSRDDDRAARFSEKLADDGAEGDDERDESERVANALLERAWNVGKRHARRDPDDGRARQQRDEGGQTQPRDEQHHERDAEASDDQERRGIRRIHGATA